MSISNVLPLMRKKNSGSAVPSNNADELPEVPEGYKPPSPLKDLKKFRTSPEGLAVVAWVRKSVDQSKNDRNTHRQQWLTNYAFYRNQQRLRNLPGGLTLEARQRIAAADKKAQRMINRVQPMVRTELAALTAQKPSAVVVPASSEDDDLFAAQAGECVYESVYSRIDLEYWFGIAAMWQVVAGNGFLKIWWNPTKLDFDAKVTGDFEITAPPPFQIFVPDMLEPEIQNQSWVAHSFVKPIEQLRRMYPEELKDVELKPSQYTSRTEIDGAVKQVDRTETAPDSCQVIEMWIKPGCHDSFPNGGLVTLVEDQLVQISHEFPYAHGNFPFYHFKHIETGTFYAESPVTPIIELQQDYNKLRGQIRESIIKMSRLQILAAKGSIITSKWTNEIGLIIETRPGLPDPRPFPVQELPNYLWQELQQLTVDIEDITGQHQVTRGQAPGQGVTAATAINALQEKDDAFRSPAYRSIEKGFRDLGRDIIQLAIQYWDVPRMVKVVGTDSAFDVLVLRGADLSNSTDLRMEAGSALPTSKAAKQAFIMDLMAQGFVPPEEGLKLMEMGGTNAVVDKMRIDERQAQRENIKLKNLTPEEIAMFQEDWMAQQNIGQETDEPLMPPPVIPVNTWDNHEVHIKVHNDFRKSQAYEQLPSEIKTLFQQHVLMHEQVMLQAQLEQGMQQMVDSVDGGMEGLDGPPEAGDPTGGLGEPGGMPGPETGAGEASGGLPPGDEPPPEPTGGLA